MAEQSDVLVVDDEPLQVRALCAALRERGYSVVEATSSDQAKEVLEQTQFRLVVLDREIFSPTRREDGLDLCRYIRQQGIPSCVIFYTKLVSPAEHRQGWAAGADDYIEKTWSVDVAIARCEAHLSRSLVRQNDSQIKRFREDRIPAGRELIVDEIALVVARAEDYSLVNKGRLGKTSLDWEDREKYRKLKMTDLDLAVFFYLFERRGEWVSEPTLLKDVWSYSDMRIKALEDNPDSKTGLVHTTVARIRRKIDTRLPAEPGDDRGFQNIHPWAYIATSREGDQTVVSYQFSGEAGELVERAAMASMD